MLSSLLLALAVIHGSWISVPGPRSKGPAQTMVKLEVRVQKFSLSAGNFVDALVQVAGKYEIPMGIECVQTHAAERPVHLAWADTTVRRIIAGIVHAQPGYEIQVKGGVVVVRPTNLLPDRENFLTERIANFDAENEVAETASQRLAALVRPVMAPARRTPSARAQGGIISSQLAEVGDPQISVSLENATVETILSAISLASPFKVWVVTFSAGPGLTSAGFRRTILRRTGKVVPDEWQPVWELLRWGQRPY